MKKFLVILMVVAMASFLFVGCIPDGAPPIDDEVPEPTPPTTVAPIITAVSDIDITSSATQYINKVEAADGIVVDGTAPTYSEVKVYINGITAGTGDAGVNGVFSVQVANADLIKAVKVDGAKTLHATAKEVGLAESADSNEIKFTLDTVAPKIKSVKARAGAFPNAYNPFFPVTITVNDLALISAINFLMIPPAVVGNVQVGTWTISVLSPSGTPNNVSIVGPDGTTTYYTCVDGGIIGSGAVPGIGIVLANPLIVGMVSEIISTKALTRGRVSLTFDEDVSWTQATGGTYTIYNGSLGWDILNFTSPIIPIIMPCLFMAYNETGDTMYWQEQAGFEWRNLRQGDWLTFQVDSVADPAGNAISVGSPATDNCSVFASEVAIGP